MQANVELRRAERDPAHFKKMALLASRDKSGMQLPEELRARFNVDINNQPFGFG